MLRDEKLVKKFWKLYVIIFNENGEMTACGRDTCKEMIEICERIDNDCKKKKYGNLKTGYLNIESIKELSLII